MSKKVALIVYGLTENNLKKKEAQSVKSSIESLLSSGKIDVVINCSSVFESYTPFIFSKFKVKSLDIRMFNNETIGKNSLLNIPSKDGSEIVKSSDYLSFLVNPDEYIFTVAGYDQNGAIPFYAREIRSSGFNTFIIPDCSSFNKKSSELANAFKVKVLSSSRIQ